MFPSAAGRRMVYCTAPRHLAGGEGSGEYLFPADGGAMDNVPMVLRPHLPASM
jgi:hypothetical protein